MTIFSSKSNCNRKFINPTANVIKKRCSWNSSKSDKNLRWIFCRGHNFGNFTTEAPLGSRQHFFPRSGSVDYIGAFQIHRKMGLFWVCSESSALSKIFLTICFGGFMWKKLFRNWIDKIMLKVQNELSANKQCFHFINWKREESKFWWSTFDISCLITWRGALPAINWSKIGEFSQNANSWGYPLKFAYYVCISYFFL